MRGVRTELGKTSLKMLNPIPVYLGGIVDHWQIEGDDVGVFLAGAAIEDDHVLVGFDPAGLGERVGGADAGGGFRAEADAFAGGAEAHPLDNAIFFDRDGRSAAGAD